MALNSDGSQWDSSIEFTFTRVGGLSSPVSFSVPDLAFPQYYSLEIESVEEFHSGVYRVMAPGEKKIWAVRHVIAMKAIAIDKWYTNITSVYEYDCTIIICT